MYKLLFFILFNFLMIITFFINKKIFKKNINYMTIFIALYTITIFFSFFNFFGFPNVSFETYLYIFIALCSLELSTIFVVSILKFKKGKIQETNYKINNFKMISLSIIFFLILIPTTIEGYKIFQELGFNYLRWAWQGDYYNQSTRMMVVYVMSPIISALTFFSLSDFINTMKLKMYLIINFISYFLIMFITGGRMMIFNLVIYIFVILYIKYNGSIKKIMIKNKKMICISVILCASIIIVSNQRSLSKDKGISFNAYSYFVGSIHLFDYYNRNPSVTLMDYEHLLYGKAMLSPITDIFKMAISFVGIDNNLTSGIEDINVVAQRYFTLSNGVTMNNNITFIYVCLRDFGLFGLILDPIYVSLVYAIIYKKYILHTEEKYKVMYYYALSILPFWIFEFYFARTTIILTFVYISIIFKIVYDKIET